MAKSLCCLLIWVNLASVANFHITNMSFNAICEDKILAKISESTVLGVKEKLPRSRAILILISFLFSYKHNIPTLYLV